MVPLFDLWLPVLLATVFVFIASSLSHMVLGVHAKDYARIGNEAAVLDAMREHNVAPAHYVFPFPESMKEMGSPEMIEKYKQGPVGYLTVMPPGVPAIGKSLMQWTGLSIVIGVFVAYLAAMVLPAGVESMTVFRFTATAAVLGYAFASVPDSIWKGLSWGITARFVGDGIAYGLLTGATFAWLWPSAA